jgi:hypothetical protein
VRYFGAISYEIGNASKHVSTRAALPWFVAAGVYCLLLAFGPRLLNDPDSYSHVALGRWILAHGAVPTTDPFSFSMYGEAWISFEWLSEVIYAAVFSFSGWSGVVALTAAMAALAMGLLTRALLRELSAPPTLLMVTAAVALLAPHLLARPHVLALPVMVAWAVALVRSMDRRGPPPYWALPLLVLWANLHGSVILGLGLIGPAILEALAETKRSEWPRVVARWLPFAALAVAACCLTPYGPGSLLMPFTTLSQVGALSYIAEWRPQDFSHFGALEMLLLAGIFMLSRGVMLPVVRVLVVLGLIHFALAQTRHADLLAVLAPLYLAAPLARQFGPTADDVAGPARVGLAVLSVMIAATALAQIRNVRPPARNTPEAAVASAGLARTGRVLNDYNFGGYLVFAGIPTFIDGRSELYGSQFVVRYNRALSLADLNDFIKLLDDYKLDTTLLDPNTPAVMLLDRLPDWQRVYSDEVAVVHKRLTSTR